MNILQKEPRKLIPIIAFIFIILAIPLTVFIAQKQQDVRQRASGEDVTFYFGDASGTPLTQLDVSAGQVTPVSLYLNTGTHNISAFNIVIHASSSLSITQSTDESGATQFESKISPGTSPINSLDNSLTYARATTDDTKTISGTLKLITIAFTPNVTGIAGVIELIQGQVTSTANEGFLSASQPSLPYTIGNPPTAVPTGMPIPTATPGPLSAPTGLTADCAGDILTFSWATVDPATRYSIHVNDIADGWNPTTPLPLDTIDDNVPAPHYGIVGTPGHSYDWWVNAVDSRGHSIDANGTRFSCPPLPTATPIPTALVLPPVPPPGGLTATCPSNLIMRFQWDPHAGIDRYAIRIDDLQNEYEFNENTPLPGDTVVNNVIPDNALYTRRGVGGHSYAWWLFAVDELGRKSLLTRGTQIDCAAPTPTITVVPTLACVQGDAKTCDRCVDLRDYNVWQDEYKTEFFGGRSAKRADFNNDGVVDLRDFGLWQENYANRFGSTCPYP